MEVKEGHPESQPFVQKQGSPVSLHAKPGRHRQAFSVMRQTANGLAFVGHKLVLQALSSAVLVQKQPQTICKSVGVAMIQ